MVKRRRQSVAGFTLVELMVALLVSSVVLSAVATLAYATSSAKEATDEMGRKQAQFRQVSMRLSDLIRRANKVVGVDYYGYGFELWHDMDADRMVDGDERVWIGSDHGNTIRIGDYTTNEIYTQCENVMFRYDDWEDGSPQIVTISFEMDENGQTQRYSISAHLRIPDDN